MVSLIVTSNSEIPPNIEINEPQNENSSVKNEIFTVKNANRHPMTHCTNREVTLCNCEGAPRRKDKHLDKREDKSSAIDIEHFVCKGVKDCEHCEECKQISLSRGIFNIYEVHILCDQLTSAGHICPNFPQLSKFSV